MLQLVPHYEFILCRYLLIIISYLSCANVHHNLYMYSKITFQDVFPSAPIFHFLWNITVILGYTVYYVYGILLASSYCYFFYIVRCIFSWMNDEPSIYFLSYCRIFVITHWCMNLWSIWLKGIDINYGWEGGRHLTVLYAAHVKLFYLMFINCIMLYCITFL